MASSRTRDPSTIPAIFFHNEEQKRIAEVSKKKLNESGTFNKPVATEIRPYTTFYPAEDYHQDYDRKNPDRYKEYKILSGREGFIEKTWDGPQEVRVYADTGMFRLPCG